MADPYVVGAKVAGAVTKLGASRIAGAFMPEKSLLDFARVGQIEPMVIIDSDIRHNPLIKDTLHVLSSLFIGYYMQAVSYDNLIGDVTITQRLEKFNPNRRVGLSMERLTDGAFAGGLPSFEAYDVAVASSKEATSEVYEDRNLAVGKMIQLKLSGGDSTKERTVPVTIRLVPMTMGSQSIIEAYAQGGVFSTAVERWHDARSGKIRWIADWIFKLDLIDQHRRTLLNDKSGVYGNLSKRRTANLVSDIVKGKRSVASAAAMSIISAKTAVDLERRLGGKLNSFKTRNDLFDMTSLMVLVVFDPNWDQFTFYFRGTDTVTQLSASEIKASSKKQNVDVSEMIQAFMAGKAPSNF